MHQPEIRELARNRWPGILVSQGIDPSFLTGKHGPCPVCGGVDRFRFDDKEGRGTWYCSSCEPRAGDGFRLLMNVTGDSFSQAAAKVRAQVGVVAVQRNKKAKADSGIAIQRILNETRLIRPGDEAFRYLTSRGITKMPAVGLHTGIAYWDGANSLGTFSAMIASARNPAGKIIALHRTFLMNGHKAPVPKPKKALGPTTGTAIRLYPAAEVMGVAEGIETSCAASQIFGMPVWAALNAVEMERFTPDPMVRELHIYADNDRSFVGQKTAATLAHRLSKAGLPCFVHVPHLAGTDWADRLTK